MAEYPSKSKDRHIGSHGYAEAILIFYNKRSKVHLTWDKLYAKKALKRNKAEDLMDYIPPDDSDDENLTEPSSDEEL